MTCQPALTKRSTDALPNPEVAPVMSAVFAIVVPPVLDSFVVTAVS
jgi:hypothetical protein